MVDNDSLKAYRERYQKSVGKQRCRQHVRVKQCLCGTPTKETSVLPKRRFSSEMNDKNIKSTIVRPLLPAPVNTDPAPEMFLFPNHDDLFVATTPGSSTEVCDVFCYVMITIVSYNIRNK